MAQGSERWEILEDRQIAEYPIFSVRQRLSRGPHGKSGRFVALDAPDWAVVVPVLETGGLRSLLMVRQYRHGSDTVCREFPGGVVEPAEDTAAAAARELLEETGYRAGRIELAGSCWPNPAFMRNRFHVFVATALVKENEQSQDEHELIDVEPVAEQLALASMGKAGWDHALMTTAAWYYVRWRESRS